MSETSESAKCDARIAKRVVHYSDGVVEEFDNHVQETDPIESSKQIAVKSWPIIGVVANTVLWFGSQTLKACDYLGENLANFFGITSPKYEYEIEEYNRRVEEHNRRQSKIESEFEGWTQSDSEKEIKLSDIKSVQNLSNDQKKGFPSKYSNV